MSTTGAFVFSYDLYLGFVAVASALGGAVGVVRSSGVLDQLLQQRRW